MAREPNGLRALGSLIRRLFDSDASELVDIAEQHVARAEDIRSRGERLREEVERATCTSKPRSK